MHCLPSVTIETATNPKHAIIWLHGLGADGHDFEPIIPQLNLNSETPVRFIFPHAPAMPVTINGGYIMPAWYDIVHDSIGIKQDEAGIRTSMERIQLLIDREIIHGIPTHNIILAGFSQGGAMALHCALRQSQPLAGIIALSCYGLLPEKTADERSKSSSQTPVFIGHGVHDDIVPFALGKSLLQQLTAWGHEICWNSYPMAHSVSPLEIKHIGAWINQQFTHQKNN